MIVYLANVRWFRQGTDYHCHCEPVRTLARQSVPLATCPNSYRSQGETDCHVAALLAMTTMDGTWMLKLMILPIGGGWQPEEADGGVTLVRGTAFPSPPQSKIKDFCQLPQRGSQEMLRETIIYAKITKRPNRCEKTRVCAETAHTLVVRKYGSSAVQITRRSKRRSRRQQAGPRR